MKIYGYANVKKGLMEKIIHKTMHCLKFKKGEWVGVTDKILASEMKKCECCFKNETKTNRRKQVWEKTK